MKKQLPYILGSLLLFVFLSLLYFSPLLLGKTLFQQDIMQYRGGAQEQIEYRNTFDKETYWSNSMFGGMPTYQSGATYSNDFLKYIDQAFGLFLPRPASYFFMMFAGFFFLGMVWLKNWKFALLGALFFGFSTYFYQITEAGHNAKVHTIVYFAPFLAGLWLLYQKQFFWGFVISTLFLGLQLHSNHPQMTFYLLVSLLAFGVFQLVKMFQNKSYVSFFQSTGLLFLALLMAVGMNAGRILSTYEYSKESTRGKSELTQKSENETTGLNKEYITDWSYGVLETVNLMIPNFYGGGNNQKDFTPNNFNSAKDAFEKNIYNKAMPTLMAMDSVQSALQNDPENPVLRDQYIKLNGEINQFQEIFEKAFSGFGNAYWGEQPFTSGPAYVGCIVFMLAIFALFWIRHPYKWWLLGATLISFMMAWGKNFPLFTDFMIDYFPFYNKFRAVSSALVVSELTLPALAMLGLYAFFQTSDVETEKKKQKSIWLVGGIIILFLLILYFAGNAILPFANTSELEHLPENLLEAIQLDRFEFFKKDVLRTLLYCSVALVALYLYTLKIIRKPALVLLILAFFSTLDLWMVDKDYLNKDSFVAAKYMRNPFPTEVTASMAIDAKDQPRLNGIFSYAPINKALDDLKKYDGSNYRVYNTVLSTFQENNTSYFHHSIGGYHGVKLGRYQEIIDAYLSPPKVNPEILNMLNTKYTLISQGEQYLPVPNTQNNGNAWFVSQVKVAKSADDEFESLGSLSTKTQAIVPKDTQFSTALAADSLAHINLDTYQPNKLVYTSESQQPQLAVFSEIYYPYGWEATIDGKTVPIIKTNYFLRGLEVPAGTHTIQFEFSPQVVKTGSSLQLISFLLFLILSLGGLFYGKKWKVDTILNRKQKDA